LRRASSATPRRNAGGLTSLLPRIVTPTLALHRHGDRAVRAGWDLADAIRGVRMVELDGDDHWLWAGDQRHVVDQIRAFVRHFEERSGQGAAARQNFGTSRRVGSP
jgi:pimeloyl-ACP methyl ester carboxylesterase